MPRTKITETHCILGIVSGDEGNKKDAFTLLAPSMSGLTDDIHTNLHQRLNRYLDTVKKDFFLKKKVGSRHGSAWAVSRISQNRFFSSVESITLLPNPIHCYWIRYTAITEISKDEWAGRDVQVLFRRQGQELSATHLSLRLQRVQHSHQQVLRGSLLFLFVNMCIVVM